MPIQNEKGIEIFYDFAITPAIRVIPSYQHIWNPLTAAVAKNHRSADCFFLFCFDVVRRLGPFCPKR